LSTSSATTSASISSVIASINIGQGDDPQAALNLLSDTRQAQHLKKIQSHVDQLGPRLAQLNSLLSVLDHIDECPDTPDGNGKILGDLAPGQSIQSGSPFLGNVIPDLARELNYNLPTQTWLEVYTRATDSTGRIVDSEPLRLKSPEDVATIRSHNTLTASGDVDQYTYQPPHSGGNVVTTYIDIYNQEGQVRATDADIASLRTAVIREIAQKTPQLKAENAELASALNNADSLLQDQSLAEGARAVEKDFNAKRKHSANSLSEGSAQAAGG